ncbi:MAG: aminotransferase class V-fold PLP-dependent enzyme [Chloroflexi bacterium]|nr:aminotransferase class V-fold PLP-dependent enzyme [Chloroflexota bacterium]
MSPSTSTKATTPVPTFQSLGVRPLINAMGTYTIISGSRALPQVAEAMVEATNHYVDMDELMDKVGHRLAELTGAEWGYIPCGCAAALTQITAACIAGADPEKMTRLPDTTGMKNEVVIQKAHRNAYDWAIRMTGANMIEVVTRADLLSAISAERTALVAITGDSEERSTIPVREMIKVARDHGIPCLVDAAAQRPDIPNRYLQMGADVVLYSGGKCLRGPQAAGLALGRKDLLQAAFLNGAPHHALGRPMKAGKEEIMGLMAAVEAWILGRDHEAEWKQWEGYLERIRAAVAEVPTVFTTIDKPGVANVAPSLFIAWDERILRCTPRWVHRSLREGEPPIALHLVMSHPSGRSGLRVMPFMMETGDDEIVARRLHELLSHGDDAYVAESGLAPAQAVDVSGTWQVDTQYVLGASTHSMTLVQNGSELKGTYRSQFGWQELEGKIQGAEIAFRATLGYQINKVQYEFAGTVEGDAMRGTVSLGEFGSAQWTAKKVGW